MLSRVADSLYWMSRYFERADNCARVIDATHSLMLTRVEVATDQRWYRALTQMGLKLEANSPDPQDAIRGLAADASNRASIVACLAARARTRRRCARKSAPRCGSSSTASITRRSRSATTWKTTSR